MEVKQIDGCLELHGDIIQGAKEAFSQLRYVEAFALIHAVLDFHMTRLHHVKNSLIEKIPSQEANNPLGRKNFLYNARYLYEKEVINSSEYGRFRRFNKIRDKVVHRIVFRNLSPFRYDGDQPEFRKTRSEICVTNDEARQAFDEAMELVKIIKDRMQPVILGMKPEEYKALVEETDRQLLEDFTNILQRTEENNE